MRQECTMDSLVKPFIAVGLTDLDQVRMRIGKSNWELVLA